MQNIGRNDVCPCNGGKKYKHCYLANNEACEVFMKEKEASINSKHEERVKSIMKALLTMTNELGQLFFQNDGVEIVPTRMQLIGIFTIIDVLAHYFNEYLGRSLKPSERFSDFVNRFCFVPENKEFSERKYLGGMTVDELYALRNGLVHFYGLAQAKYCILPNVTKIHSADDIAKAHGNFIELGRKLGRELLFVQPIELKKIVIAGAGLVIEHLSQNEATSLASKEARAAHISGIERIHKKLEKEGASFVNKEMADRLQTLIEASKNKSI